MTIRMLALASLAALAGCNDSDPVAMSSTESGQTISQPSELPLDGTSAEPSSPEVGESDAPATPVNEVAQVQDADASPASASDSPQDDDTAAAALQNEAGMADVAEPPVSDSSDSGSVSDTESGVRVPEGLTNGQTLAAASTAWSCSGAAFDPGSGTLGFFEDQSGAILDAGGRGDPIDWTVTTNGRIDFTRDDGLTGRFELVEIADDSLTIGTFVFNEQTFGALACTRIDAAFVQ